MRLYSRIVPLGMHVRWRGAWVGLVLAGLHCGETPAPQVPPGKDPQNTPAPPASGPDVSTAGWQVQAPASETPQPSPPPIASFQGNCREKKGPGRSPEAGYYAPTPANQAMARLRPRWKSCYNQGLTRNPALSGKVVVRAEIDEDGRVCQAIVQESTLSDSEVVNCVLQSFSAAQFPPHTNSVTLVYPIVFSPGR